MVVYLISGNFMMDLTHLEENKGRLLLHVTRRIHLKLIEHLTVKNKVIKL